MAFKLMNYIVYFGLTWIIVMSPRSSLATRRTGPDQEAQMLERKLPNDSGWRDIFPQLQTNVEFNETYSRTIVIGDQRGPKSATATHRHSPCPCRVPEPLRGLYEMTEAEGREHRSHTLFVGRHFVRTANYRAGLKCKNDNDNDHDDGNVRDNVRVDNDRDNDNVRDNVSGYNDRDNYNGNVRDNVSGYNDRDNYSGNVRDNVRGNNDNVRYNNNDNVRENVGDNDRGEYDRGEYGYDNIGGRVARHVPARERETTSMQPPAMDDYRVHWLEPGNSKHMVFEVPITRRVPFGQSALELVAGRQCVHLFWNTPNTMSYWHEDVTGLQRGCEPDNWTEEEAERRLAELLRGIGPRAGQQEAAGRAKRDGGGCVAATAFAHYRKVALPPRSAPVDEAVAVVATAATARV